jgi:hypothetical protein
MRKVEPQVYCPLLLGLRHRYNHARTLMSSHLDARYLRYSGWSRSLWSCGAGIAAE